MHLFFAIALTSLSLVAGMYLLAKTRTENLGKFYGIISWFIIVVAGLSLLCQVGISTCWVVCYHGHGFSENYSPEKMHHEMYMHHSGTEAACGESEDCCEGGRHGRAMGGCCEMGRGHGHGEGYQHGEGRHGCMGDDDEEEDDAVKKDSVKAK